VGVSLVAFAHTFNDLYATALAPLLPALVEKLGLSLTMAGGLGAVMTMVSVSQPLYGYLADRWTGRLFLFLGPLLGGLSMGALGMAPNYLMLMILVLIAGTGSAMFHPTGAAMANVVSGDRKGLGMSIFMAGGSLGRGAGPLVMVFIVTTLGLANTWIIVIPAVLLLLAARVLPPAQPSAVGLDLSAARRIFAQNARPLFILWSIIAIRVATESGIVTFLPLFLKSRGASLQLAGSTVSVFLLTGILGTILGGYLSDRFGARSTFIGSALVAVPMFYVSLHTSGMVSLVAVGIAGFCLTAAHAINLVMAQELVPRHASTVSGFMMGVAFAVSGVIVIIVGWTGDQIGLAPVLNVLAAAMLLTVPFALTLPHKPRPSKPAAVESM
jgi:FSR family fosmidomycin resistance protein-like MFS transporter